MPSEYTFVDSSAFFALLDRAHQYHAPAREIWPSLLRNDAALVTTNYMVMETMTLLQDRIGFEGARVWHQDMLTVVEVSWVDQAIYGMAYELWLNLGRQGISMVDCISFITMNQNHIDKVFGFKANYLEHGFRLIPSSCVCYKTL